MGEHVKLRAADGFELDAYVARPEGTPVAGLVVVQEAFGVNHHIREVTDEWAKDGFLAVAPALFDRVQRGVELGYGQETLQQAMGLIRQGNTDDRVMDVAAALDYVRRETGKKVGVIGYCLGGSMAWLAATRLNPDAAVGYYGSMIAQYGGEALHAPVMLHFGQEDTHIPKDQIDAKVAAAHPEVPIYWYAGAGHGFNTSDRQSYNPEAARLARERSLAFLKKNLDL
ncbi:MAG TPA: dienelactone hydrolase family protein [Acidobacteriaceae bacterium]|jgi:carboxymethylenebutenolidase|nr:dienelactone hydrolase family protein [Acidobacteriaceae bacterium]